MVENGIQVDFEKERLLALYKDQSGTRDRQVILPNNKIIPVVLENEAMDFDSNGISKGVELLNQIQVPVLDKVEMFLIADQDIPNPYDSGTYCTGYRRKDALGPGKTVIQLYPYAFEKGKDHDDLSGVPRAIAATVHEGIHEIDRFPELVKIWAEITGWSALSEPEVLVMQDGTKITRRFIHDPQKDTGTFSTKYAQYSLPEDVCESGVAYVFNRDLSDRRRAFFNWVKNVNFSKLQTN